MDRLQIRAEEARRIVDRRRRRDPRHHSFRKEGAVVRPRHELPQERANDPVALRDGGEHLLQRPPTRPPELVGVARDDPVGAELLGGEPRHPGRPLPFPHLLSLLADEVQVPAARIRLEDRKCPVFGAMIRRDDEVDPGVEVKGDLRIDDVRLVAGAKRHHDLHLFSAPRA